jgi:hypothetical protein
VNLRVLWGCKRVKKSLVSLTSSDPIHPSIDRWPQQHNTPKSFPFLYFRPHPWRWWPQQHNTPKSFGFFNFYSFNVRLAPWVATITQNSPPPLPFFLSFSGVQSCQFTRERQCTRSLFDLSIAFWYHVFWFKQWTWPEYWSKDVGTQGGSWSQPGILLLV